ncbi:unnamed protein product [Rotaria sordida]|uniref:Interferon-induced very large GTPase 1-like n=1 Tax=Rotaria sordida TaxID=392033 RepID=A0A818ZE55_9BILA|nr:unnamed protein product [Rotaria sordida]
MSSYQVIVKKCRRCGRLIPEENAQRRCSASILLKQHVFACAVCSVVLDYNTAAVVKDTPYCDKHYSVARWSIEDVVDWLEKVDLETLEDRLREAKIDGKKLLTKGFNEYQLRHLHPSSAERKQFQKQRARLKICGSDEWNTRRPLNPIDTPSTLYLAKSTENIFDNISHNSHDSEARLRPSQKTISTVDLSVIHTSLSQTFKDNVIAWTVDDVAKWLATVSLHKYIDSFKSNEIDGETLLDFDTEMENEMIPVGKDRIAFRRALKKLREGYNTTEPVPTPRNVNENQQETYATSHYTWEFSRAAHNVRGSVADNQHQVSTNLIDVALMLQPDMILHSISLKNALFETNVTNFIAKWCLFFCPSLTQTQRLSNELDSCFITIIDEPMNARILLNDLIKHHTIKTYIVDSLKRYHALDDIRTELPKCKQIKYDETIYNHDLYNELIRILPNITIRMLLISTVESLSYDSQRYLGNFIKRNDLPIPFTYYLYNNETNLIEYKINFNLLAEVQCLSTEHLIIQVGSPTTIGLGKTSLLPYIFRDIRKESLNTSGLQPLRSGCIDTLFGTAQIDQNKEKSCVIFDVHGTILSGINDTIILALQQYASLQFLYVTEADLETNFLPNMINNSISKPTIVCIFDDHYDKNLHDEHVNLVRQFINRYRMENWSHIQWLLIPTKNTWLTQSDNQQYDENERIQTLHSQLSYILQKIDQTIIHPTLFRTIFQVQSSYWSFYNGMNTLNCLTCYFEVERKLKQLFNELSDTTDNLLIATPISYLQSKIRQSQMDLPRKDKTRFVTDEVQRYENLLKKIDRISDHTQFFIDLLTKRTYIEVLITEKYLEQWRSIYESRLRSELTNAKHKMIDLTSELKRVEMLEKQQKLNKSIEIQQQLQIAKENYEQSYKTLNEIETKLMNIDMTIGLFFDEILSISDYNSYLKNSLSIELLNEIAQRMTEMMHRGIAVHVLRGRPLQCESILLKIILKNFNKWSKPPCIITVIGEQSSAKSSLLNTTFGCNFHVSSGRCTMGIYMSIIKWKSLPIVLLDIEGLMSVEESSSLFDNQMVSMAILSSHIVLINHKGELSTELQNLIGMSFYAKLQLKDAPLKPKVLFILRDQIDLSNKKIFFAQLAQLKQNLNNVSQFLQISIEDELNISNDDVVPLSNAFSNDINPVFGGEVQKWRNKTFPIQIQELRSVLLASKNLLELAMMNEVRDIAREIIQKANNQMYDNGQVLIKQTIADIKNNSQLISTTGGYSNASEDFNMILNRQFQQILEQAYKEFDFKTNKSYYLPHIKEKIKIIIEPRLRFTCQSTRQQFEDNLHLVSQAALVKYAQQKLIDRAQEDFDQNKSIGIDEFRMNLENDYQCLLKECRQQLDVLHEKEDDISKKILKFYNNLHDRKAANPTVGDIYNLLPRLDIEQYKRYCQKFEHSWKQINQFLDIPHDNLFSSSWQTDLNRIWIDLKDKLKWFNNKKSSEKNRTILSGIFNVVLPKLKKDIIKLIMEIKLSYNDPEIVNAVISYVENSLSMKEIKDFEKNLNLAELVTDFVIISLKILISEVTLISENNYQKELTKSENQLREWKTNIEKQFESMKNSFEQGQYEAEEIGKQIFAEVKSLLLNQVLRDVKSDVMKNKFIIHDHMRKNAYQQSFQQNNGENILKYVLDINRYLLELSLEEVLGTFRNVVSMHTNYLDDLLSTIFITINNTIQSYAYDDINSTYNAIENAISEINLLKKMKYEENDMEFKLEPKMNLPIKDPKQFQLGFKHILTVFASHSKSEKEAISHLLSVRAFEDCKLTIKRRLGCEHTCPGCGVKYSKPSLHSAEQVKILPENCKCTTDECICPEVTYVDCISHENDYHIPAAFYGQNYYETRKLYLHSCYQQWTTVGIHTGDGEIIHPKRLYYNKKYLQWYKNLDNLAKTAPDKDDPYPTEEQRHA